MDLKTVAWLRRLFAGLSPRRSGFALGSVWDLWWTKWHWDRFHSECFGFHLSILFHHGSPHSYIIWGMNNRLVGGRSSETWSNPIDMNNKIAIGEIYGKWTELSHNRSVFAVFYLRALLNVAVWVQRTLGVPGHVMLLHHHPQRSEHLNVTN
jgi:hypothetical protein